MLHPDKPQQKPQQEARAKRAEHAMNPGAVLVLGFLLLILLGTGLMMLPGITKQGTGLPLFDALFTATSAVCVTGLVAVDTGSTFSGMGQAILLVLIQVGGLGFMVFATLVMGMLGRRLSLKNRMLIRDSMSASSMKGLMGQTGICCGIAFGTEALGALLLSFRFVPAYGWGKGIWYSVFHAISAFCNAGFDLFGGYASLTGFWRDGWVLLVVSLMIIVGGTGFFVISELVRERCRWSKLSLHTQLVLVMQGTLLLAGTLFYLLAEWGNPATLGMEGANVGTRLLNAFFQSVTMRTAGFNSVSLGDMTGASKLFSCFLMFIGASPVSTGGGVKTTTVAAILLIVTGVLRGRTDTQVFKRRLPTDLVRRALSIVFISFALTMGCVMGLTVFEHDGVPFIDLLFEASSAVATVGVSAVGSPSLTMGSRAWLIPAMYLGRVGPMTLALVLAARLGNANNRVHYAEENVLIG